jgi:hypothetical protein
MSGQWEGGKGSKQRPTDIKKYSDNWDRIFKSKNQKDKQREATDLNWDGQENEEERANWYGYSEQDEEEDSVPQNSIRSG